jgi:hypothetical protein
VSTAIRRSLYGKLSGDTTLNNLLGAPPAGYSKSIYDGVAPKDAAFPYVIFNLQSDVDEEAMADPAAYTDHIWMIKGVDGPGEPPKSTAPSGDAADAIADRIRVLLNDTTLSISGASLMYLRRQSGVRYPEVTEGVTYRHSGGLYRLVWQ